MQHPHSNPSVICVVYLTAVETVLRKIIVREKFHNIQKLEGNMQMHRSHVSFLPTQVERREKSGPSQSRENKMAEELSTQQNFDSTSDLSTFKS